MPTQIFVNLPVKNLDKSIAFFKHLGFSFNAQFTNEKATSMIISDTIYVMLLTESFFKTFTSKSISDAHQSTEVINCLSAESADKVNEMVNKAVEAGGKATTKQDHGWMYQWGFEDLDGHLWEIAYMDMSKLPQNP